jgi:hypothetical protein
MALGKYIATSSTPMFDEQHGRYIEIILRGVEAPRSRAHRILMMLEHRLIWRSGAAGASTGMKTYGRRSMLPARYGQLSAMKAVPRTARRAPSHALADGAFPVLSHTIGRTRIGASEDKVDTIPTLPLASAAIKSDIPRPVAMTAPAALIAKRRKKLGNL